VNSRTKGVGAGSRTAVVGFDFAKSLTSCSTDTSEHAQCVFTAGGERVNPFRASAPEIGGLGR
jgi:hypothetical protein